MSLKQQLLEEFEKWQWNGFENPPISLEQAAFLAGAKAGMERAIKEVCYHDEHFPKYKDCCYNKERIVALIRELEEK